MNEMWKDIKKGILTPGGVCVGGGGRVSGRFRRKVHLIQTLKNTSDTGSQKRMRKGKRLRRWGKVGTRGGELGWGRGWRVGRGESKRIKLSKTKK